MPVRFKGMSEYEKRYNWHDSIRSRSFTPTEEQASDPAGKASLYASMSYEPPIQHKKRVDGPPTSLSTNFYGHSSRDAEYTLLGQQEKFADNVRYTAKIPKTQPKVYKNKENFDEDAPPNKQLRMQKRIKPLFKERHPPVARSPPWKSENFDILTPQSPPPAPRVDKSVDLDDIKDALKDKDLKDVLGENLEKERYVKTTTKAEKSVSKAKDKGSNVEVSVMNEGVQTNMKKGVAQSAPEAPAEYALKYKAGIAPPRPVKKFSEYQKQFQWKHGQKASPLLAAEQIVYSSNTELGPYKTDAIPKVSEYRRNFQPWKPLPVDSHLNLNANNNDSNNNNDSKSKDRDSKKKAVVRRSKSAAADLHKEKVDEEDESGANELKEKLKKSHGKIRRLGSEYQANFKSPSAYYHSGGAWKGADPPQLMPGMEKRNVDTNKNNNNTNNNNAEDSVPMSNWFAEVVELRRRAEEYRKRAQGTHFSREHLVQLMAKQNECWDLDSQASSTIRALNLEAPVVKKRPAQKQQDSPLLSDVEVEDLEEQGDQSDDHAKYSHQTMSRGENQMNRLKQDKAALSRQQRQMKEKAKKEEEVELGDDDDDIVEDDEGRQPTPVLKQAKTSVSRHHLDLTTPAVGGALLTCPPSKSNKMIVTSRSGDSYVTVSDNTEVTFPPKKVGVDKLSTRPILGQPSGDTHALRDDDASSDRPLNTRYVPSPALISSDEDKENSPCKDHKSSKPSKGVKPGKLTPVQEGVGKTFVKQKAFLTLDDVRAKEGKGCSIDDDVMSVSMMSVASSASLASEVLERAKKRQKEFWGNAGAEKKH